VLREAVLPGSGDRLTVRVASEDDVDELSRLYDDLDTDDRRFRFFGLYRPPRGYFVSMCHDDPARGRTLVAIVGGDDGKRIVGEATYVVLPNGNGELDIVVDGAWRGWLGPYLLDALAEEAASNGVPNLEADVLLENRRMMALIRSRGYAIIDRDDLHSVRVVIGAGRRVPTWVAGGTRPRLLIEGTAGQWRAESAGRSAGLDVMVCPGPLGRNGRRCPALHGEQCPLAAGADGIVVALGDEELTTRLVAAHRRLHSAVRLCRDEAALRRLTAHTVG
jgi:RimJ/RimL family protein N-acetyltransferase